MNQHQITVTRNDDRTVAFTFQADYTGAAAVFRSDLFTRTGTVSVNEGVTTVEVAVAGTDTEHAYRRRAHRYEVEVTTSGGDVLTVRRGLLVVVPDIEPGVGLT